MPPVAGITPRKTAWTAATCSICSKIAANRQVINALGKSIPASETTMPQVPPNFLPIRTVSATKLIPGVNIHKFQRCINSSIDSHLCFSINSRCIKNVVDAPPPKDCSPMPAQMRKSCHLPGLGSCSFIRQVPNSFQMTKEIPGCPSQAPPGRYEQRVSPQVPQHL